MSSSMFSEGAVRSPVHRRLRSSSGLAYSAEAESRPLLYVGFFILFVNWLLRQVGEALDVPMAFPVLVGFAYATLMVRCLLVFLGQRVRDVLMAVALLCLCSLSYRNSGQTYLMSVGLLICGMGSYDIKRFIKSWAIFASIVIGFLAVVQLGIFVYDGSLPGSVLRASGTVRLSFLLAHPNTLAAFCTMAFIAFSLSWRILTVPRLIVGLLTLVGILAVTDSRTSAGVLAIYLVLRIWLDHSDKDRHPVLSAVFFALPIAFSVVCYCAMASLLPTEVYNALQQLLSGRPGYWLLQYQQIGLTLFGQPELAGNVYIDGWLYTSMTIDSFYAASLVQLGSWCLAVFIFLYWRAGMRFLKARDWGLLVALLVCAIFGLTEIHMANPVMCPLILLIGDGLFDWRQLDVPVDDESTSFSAGGD